jgi:hypothetical protein
LGEKQPENVGMSNKIVAAVLFGLFASLAGVLYALQEPLCGRRFHVCNETVIYNAAASTRWSGRPSALPSIFCCAKAKRIFDTPAES